MKKLLIILPLIFLFACAIPTIPTVNVSDELKQIVYADETTEKQDGKWTLALGSEIHGGIYVSVITVAGETVRVDYMLMLPNASIVGFFSDKDGDGKIDEYGEIINGIPSQYPKEFIQECYESYLIFAREVSKNGVYYEPKKGTKDA